MEDRVYNPQRITLDAVKGKSGIYQIQNRINNHFYIGSAVDITKRIRAHLNQLRKQEHTNKHLQRAFDLYGEESFDFYIIEFCEPDIRYNVEQYWIDKFFGKDFFYNMNPIATQPPIQYGAKAFSEKAKKNMRKAVIKGVVCLETGEHFESVTDAAHALNVPRVTLSKVCKGIRKTCGNLHFRYYVDYKDLTETDIYEIIHTKRKLPKAKPCVCLETGLIYESVLAATRAMGMRNETIGLVCDGVRKTAAGFRWMYKEDYDKLTSEELQTILNTPTHQVNKPCVCLETGMIYESIYQAARQTGLNRHSMEAVCKGRLKSLNGLHFKLKEDYDKMSAQEIQDVINYKKPIKKCLCLDNGILYDSVADAEKALGVQGKFIRAVCSGKRNHTYGYHFKYVD